MAILRSDEAEHDLELIWLGAVRDYGIAHAYRVITRLDDLFGHLHRFPKMGRQYPELRYSIRYFPVKTYPFIVFFLQQGSDISIIRILHERMRPEDHL